MNREDITLTQKTILSCLRHVFDTRLCETSIEGLAGLHELVAHGFVQKKYSYSLTEKGRLFLRDLDSYTLFTNFKNRKKSLEQFRLAYLQKDPYLMQKALECHLETHQERKHKRLFKNFVLQNGLVAYKSFVEELMGKQLTQQELSCLINKSAWLNVSLTGDHAIDHSLKKQVSQKKKELSHLLLVA